MGDYRATTEERLAARQTERAAAYDRLRKMPRYEVIAEAKRASRVNGITDKTSKTDAIHFILDERYPMPRQRS